MPKVYKEYVNIITITTGKYCFGKLMYLQSVGLFLLEFNEVNHHSN